MAVVATNSYGWLMDHKALWNRMYKNTSYVKCFCQIEKDPHSDINTLLSWRRTSDNIKSSQIDVPVNKVSELPIRESGKFVSNDSKLIVCHVCSEECKQSVTDFKIQDSMFEIHHPYLMDTQFEKYLSRELSGKDREDVHPTTLNIRRKQNVRKRKYTNEGIEAAEHFHKQVHKHLQDAVVSLTALGHDCGHFVHKDQLSVTNNTDARAASKLEMGIDLPRVDTEILLSHRWDCRTEIADYELSSKQLTERFLYNDDLQPRCIQSGIHSYLIPSQCAFVMSDISHCHQLLMNNIGDKRFDLIVLDPPWQNKSVKRQKKYWCLQEQDLLHLPVPSLATNDALIIVWTTNKQQQQDFVKGTLFPYWSVTWLAQWFWVKVTIAGEMVACLDSVQKKPYETLLLGRCTRTSETLAQTVVPDKKVLVSVPCSIHSKKPPLKDILQPYLPSEPQCLELFARNLLSGWTSWGNEVLRHQDISLYEVATPVDVTSEQGIT